ncbi:uncharacterized protein LOC129602308 [Paramacrobiotus metropolitanus]|uniref:uncharacterized protein LOC129602308 n=1 Tax=Paramacrobiotus metropolitanus TaxID=2943436 RepID=UPI00244600B2|nr:uncharacterized protein LOC129602308 [Paramacrobiotus metropolitanus]
MLNCRLSKWFAYSLWRVIYDPSIFPPLIPLPARERRFLVPFDLRRQKLPIDNMEIRLDKLVMQCADEREHFISRFMWGVDAHCVPIPEEVYSRVAKVHARWQRSLAYPAEWQTIRKYLSMYSGFHADGSPRTWDDVDLRRMDVRQLSKQALLSIDAAFGVRPFTGSSVSTANQS